MDSTISKTLISNMGNKEFKSLFQTKPYKHVLAMMYNWLVIITVISAYLHFNTFYLYPIAIIIIGARMHALTILMHDATHYRFLKNRKWNDIISNFFTMYPIFTSIERYRANHLMHHQHLNSEDDPDWVAKLTKREFQFPKSKREFLITTFSYFTMYQGILDAIWFAKRYKNPDKKKKQMSKGSKLKVVFYILLFGVVTFFGIWKIYLIFWIVPYLTTFFMFQYIRSVAEHYGEMAYEDDLSSSRTVRTSFLEEFFFAPHSVGYHLEHHLFPGVPFYNLKRLHSALMEQDLYRSRAHITNGYVHGLLNELGRV